MSIQIIVEINRRLIHLTPATGGKRVQTKGRRSKPGFLLLGGKSSARFALMACMATFLFSNLVCTSETLGSDLTTKVLMALDSRPHPDGYVGSISAVVGLIYSSASRREAGAFTDLKQLTGKLNWIAQNRLTLFSSFEIHSQDSSRLDVRGGAKIYLKDPMCLSGPVNPDGAIGSPILALAFGWRMADSFNRFRRMVGSLELRLPLSGHLTFTGGYQYYEEKELFDVVDSYAAVSFYPVRFGQNSHYRNPDGPIGIPSFRLSGGGSRSGYRITMMTRFPANRSLTMAAILKAEKAYNPQQTLLGAGVKIFWYPSGR